MAGNRTPATSFALNLMSTPRRALLALTSGAVLLGAFWMWDEIDRRIEGSRQGPGDWWGKRATQLHYGREVHQWSEDFELPEAYLLALIQLESGGRKPAGKRFETHVYDRLVAVRNGRRERYEQITSKDLAGASNEAIRNLATSWGPFQLMGYKCIQLDVQLRDIRGKDAVREGAKWIDLTYGHVLRAGRFEDAFHLHNTGKPYPADGQPMTFHPDYVQRGMAYMRNFAEDARQ